MSTLNQVAVSGPSSLLFGGSATIGCIIGYKWADNSLTNFISCGATGIWGFPIECIRMRALIIFNLMFILQNNFGSVEFKNNSFIKLEMGFV